MISNNTDQENGTFKCPNIGLIKTKYHRAIPSEFTTCNIKYEAGKWYLVLTVKVKKQPKTSGNSSVGIDINSLEYVTSDGEIIPIPRFLGESQARIKRIQRRLARKVKGSSNRKKWQLRLARQHDKIKCQRLDFFHKTSSCLVDNYDIICLEDLNVKAIQRFNGHITKDNLFAGFRQMIEYKAELYGKQVVVVDRYYASTKTCSNCGNVQSISLKERTYKCNCCGTEISRDYNAAVNINRAGSARIYACGDWGSAIDSEESIATSVCEAGSPVL
jgi:putative transposase